MGWGRERKRGKEEYMGRWRKWEKRREKEAYKKNIEKLRERENCALKLLISLHQVSHQGEGWCFFELFMHLQLQRHIQSIVISCLSTYWNKSGSQIWDSIIYVSECYIFIVHICTHKFWAGPDPFLTLSFVIMCHNIDHEMDMDQVS